MDHIVNLLVSPAQRPDSLATLGDMGKPDPLEAAVRAVRAFAAGGDPGVPTPLGLGHIHRTYAVSCGDRDLVLQHLNTEIFPDLDALTENLLRVTQHLAQAETRSEPERRVLTVVRAADGGALHRDASGGVWRAFAKIRDAEAAGSTRDPSALAAAAAAFGDFARKLSELPAPPLHTTIARFHDFPRRRGVFENSVATDPCGRAAGATEAIAATRDACTQLERLLPEAELANLPRRVAHHDCKLDNLLVDSTSREPLCVIDLDTTMPGTWLSDFGELVRSATAGAPEDAGDTYRVEIDVAAFDALASGWLHATAPLLIDAERRALPLAGARLAAMNGLRFLTDYLEGDVYFRSLRSDQNLDRARTQTRLAVALLARVADLRDCVERALD